MTPDTSLTMKGTTIESPLLRVEVNRRTGHVTRIYDKRRGKEVLARGEAANLLKVYMEKPHGMSAWSIGQIAAIHQLDKADLVRVTERGPVRATIEVWRHWNHSTFIQRIHVYRDLARVDFDLEAHWFELSTPRTDAPMLRVAFPLNVSGGRFFCDTPFAAVERPTDGREVPAQKWIDLSGPAGGAALLNDSKYGHRCDGHVLETTMLRASVDPDPYPDQGPHTIRYSLLPHAGDWVRGRVAEEAMYFNTPLLAIETPPGQTGDAKRASSLLTLSPADVQLTAVKQAEEDGAMIVRVVETYGRATQAVVTLPRPARSVTRVNLLEEPIKGVKAPTVRGTRVTVPVRPHEIVTLKVVLR